MTQEEYKEKYKRENEIREKALTAYFERIKDKFKVGDVLCFSGYHNREECAILLKNIYTQRDCGELFIKIPISEIGRRLYYKDKERSYFTYEIFRHDECIIKHATEEEIEQSVRKFIKEEIDDKRYEIKEAKDEIKKLNKIKLSLYDRLEELKEDISQIKKTSL